MADARPSPIITPEISMAGYDWFPLYFDRLRRSRWWRRATDLARARNVMLWGEAYKATPAGSLADDDDELAESAGFGFDVEGFVAHKAEIMAPWVLCSDGRWYHETICEVVLEAWDRRSERRRKDSARQAEYRARTRLSRVTPPPVTREIATQTDRTDKTNTVASALPLTTVEGGGARLAEQERWKADSEFCALWASATPQMRQRARSRAKVWAEWSRVRKTAQPGVVLIGLRGYLAGDPDVRRTGGPGLHIWLRDRTFEIWAGGDAEAERSPEWWANAVGIWAADGRWGDTMGPRPNEPGCRAPQAALAQFGLGLRVVGGDRA